MNKNLELELLIKLVERRYNKVFIDYEELALIINKEFKTNYTKEDIWNHEEMLLDIEDQKLMLKNVGL